MAPDGWQTYKLGDVTNNFDHRRVPVKKADRRAGPYPYYGASGMVDRVADYLFDGEYLLIAEDGENLRTRSTPVAFIANGRFWVNNHAHIVRGNHLANTRFIAYALQGAEISGYLTGSTMPKLTQGNMNQIPLTLPPRSEQDSIVRIVRTLDDKIELNRRMNETLEAIARAIFKSWFVDFDPVRAKAEGRQPTGLDDCTGALFPDTFQDSALGRIPTGWRVVRLDAVADVVDCLHSRKPSGHDQGRLLLQVYNVGLTGRLDLTDRFLVSKADYREWTKRIELTHGDTVVTKTGRVGAVAQVPRGIRAGLGRNMVGIRSRPRLATARFLRDWMLSASGRREIHQSTLDGTILRSLHVKAVEALRLLLPPYEVLTRYETAVSALHHRAEANDAESETLAAIRDALLPKLLSGEIRVRQAEKTVRHA